MSITQKQAELGALMVEHTQDLPLLDEVGEITREECARTLVSEARSAWETQRVIAPTRGAYIQDGRLYAMVCWMNILGEVQVNSENGRWLSEMVVTDHHKNPA